jgi:hypothetical protein
LGHDGHRGIPNSSLQQEVLDPGFLRQGVQANRLEELDRHAAQELGHHPAGEEQDQTGHETRQVDANVLPEGSQ